MNGQFFTAYVMKCTYCASVEALFAARTLFLYLLYTINKKYRLILYFLLRNNTQ